MVTIQPSAPSSSSSTHRPTVMATKQAVVSGHYLASQAGFQILEAGGNAVDAGCAVGMATGVLESQFVGIAGIAPVLFYMADRNEVLTIGGIGVWPKKATCEYFQKNFNGEIPIGIQASVVPPAPGAWILALKEHGTKTFADVAEPAIRLARDGFAMYPFLQKIIREQEANIRLWPSNTAVYLPNGRVPEIGEIFRQVDIAKTLQYMVDEEKAHSGRGRKAGLQAAWDAFYKGDIAATIDRYYRENGGLLTREDMAAFALDFDPPCRGTYQGLDIYTSGPWGQGPSLLQGLNLLKGYDLKAMGHNSIDYIHVLTEVIKLVAADREAYFGDPKFVDVPMEALLSDAYAVERRKMIRPNEAWPDMPAAGKISGGKWPTQREKAAGRRGPVGGVDVPAVAADRDLASMDTSYFCVMDRHGNVFSATPSDGILKGPIVPGTGILPAMRGMCSWADPDHPSCVAPGKRPRTTMGPALAMQDGKMVMPFGTPGSDVQLQTMLQVLMNIVHFGMDTQTAIESPRFASYSFPNSFAPHTSYPGRLSIESRIDRKVGDALAARGHKIEWWPDRAWPAGSACAILKNLETGVMSAGADFRRTAYAIGW
jgi:gamma-glutamyltranspeptidase/glutathione hydrolase